MNANQEYLADLLAVAPLLKEVLDHGEIDAEMLSDMSTIVVNPGNRDAADALRERFEPKKILSTIFPTPRLPAPWPGEVDGLYRVAHVEGQPDSPFGVTEEESDLNLLVFGEQGFGKSTFIKGLLVSIMEQDDA